MKILKNIKTLCILQSNFVISFLLKCNFVEFNVMDMSNFPVIFKEYSQKFHCHYYVIPPTYCAYENIQYLHQLYILYAEMLTNLEI